MLALKNIQKGLCWILQGHFNGRGIQSQYNLNGHDSGIQKQLGLHCHSI